MRHPRPPFSEVHSRRTSALRAAGMELASAGEQELFWRRYNEERRNRGRRFTRIGEAADLWLAREASAADDVLARVLRLWNRMASPEFSGRTSVEAVNRKVLRIVVDSKTTQFAVRRRVEKAFLAAAAGESLGVDVERIYYRVGRVPREA